MRTLLGLSALAVAVVLPRLAFAGGGSIAPVPVYKEWMPSASPIDSNTTQRPGTAAAPVMKTTNWETRPTSKSTPSTPVSTTTTTSAVVEADKPDEPPVHFEDPDGRLHALVDAVFGFGATPVINQTFAGPLLTQENRSYVKARFATQSINLGLSYAVFDQLRLSVMAPVGSGSLYADQTRETSIAGNVTVGAEYSGHLSGRVDGYAGVGVALPTATGQELPSAREFALGNHYNQTDADRFSIQRAMSDSRGREDIAAFEPNHIGVTPKLGAIWKASNRAELEPSVSYASLHPNQASSSYEGAVVVAGRATYRLGQRLDATVRVWANVPVAGDMTSVVAFAEPQLRGHFGAIYPTLGAILPFVGELRDPYVVGARAAIAARF
jgi:hypothetical protein